ncbi:Protein NLRC5 [Triplophysa tibetana]|uniref:Protein NLRC5 n=1 Tax=Triplophysa tibetana TaxID=1572043 RepID=A0A5A9P1V3_9TELE|nr:Protein NLRC5 [Triplophysa tibetana]
MERVECLGDIQTVVAQEASAVGDLLCEQDIGVLNRILDLVEPTRQDQLRSLANTRDCVLAVIEYFKTSDCTTCRQFLRTVLHYCENIPFLLETTLVSIAENTSDYLQSYTDALKCTLLQKHESVIQSVVKDICLDDTWVYLRHRNPNKTKDRTSHVSPDQQDGEDASSEHKVSVESLLKTSGRLLVLLGQAGSGKTLLVHCLGRRWADGAFPSIHLLFLLEFRQLNLMSRDLSLKELLFLFYPPSEDFKEPAEAVFEFIFSNPEKVCFIFDGYDEFRSKFTNPEKLDSAIDLNKPMPMPDLLSGLCNHKILPNCTVLVTCRPRDVTDMFGSPGFVTCELMGFDRLGVKEYAEQYFHKKGDELKQKAVNLLMDNRHLLSMCHVPGLCHICCVCMDYLFSSVGDHGSPQLPISLTQIYIQILSAFLSRSSGSPMSGIPMLQRYKTKIIEMSQLALSGLEKSTIVFMDAEVSPELQDFGVRTGILSRVKLTREDGSSGYGFTFMHLTMQEFLAAINLMTSQIITESQLKKKLNLKTRWTTKTDPKSVFTDSLHLYVCGLAAEACTLSLVQLKGADGGATTWVQKRQAAVRNFLRSLAGSASQTGPKIVELCRCVHETQDTTLARAVGSRPQFELRNIRLNAVDMEALAFVTADADQAVCLDFGGCSIDLDCLEILPSFKNVDHLIFRSRKYDDKFAEALCGILHELQALRRLEMGKNNISTDGVLMLTEMMTVCPSVQEFYVEGNKEINISFSKSSDTSWLKQCNITYAHVASLSTKLKGFITVLDLSKNSLGNKGLKKILDLMPKLGMIQEINVSKNGVDMDGLVLLVSALCTQRNLRRVDASLTHSEIQPTYMTKLFRQLVKCENLLDIEFSHLKLSNESLEKLMSILPEMSSLQLLNLSHVDMSTNGALSLVRSLVDCQRVTAVELRHQAEAFIKFVPVKAEAAICRLMEYKLNRTNVEKLSRILEDCPHLAELDLSHNLLRDEGVKCFVDCLPKLKISSSVSLNGNRMTQLGALHLVNSMNTCEKVVAVEVSLGVEDQSLILFVQEHVNGKTLRLKECSFEVNHLEKLVEILKRCPRLLTLEWVFYDKLRNNGLSLEQIEYFLKQLSCYRQHRDIRIEELCLTGSAVVSLVSNCLHLESQIEEIRFSQLKMDRKGVEFFSVVIPSLVSLKNFSLDMKGTAEDDVAVLVEALPKAQTIENVSLSRLVLNDNGAAVFGMALQNLPHLKSLK